MRHNPVTFQSRWDLYYSSTKNVGQCKSIWKSDYAKIVEASIYWHSFWKSFSPNGILYRKVRKRRNITPWTIFQQSSRVDAESEALEIKFEINTRQFPGPKVLLKIRARKADALTDVNSQNHIKWERWPPSPNLASEVFNCTFTRKYNCTARIAIEDGMI